jgi:AraC-like DNA-binding protein
MHISHFKPADILKPYIRTFMIIESEHGTENKLLPDTSVVIAFRFRGKITNVDRGAESTLPFSVISGLRTSSRTIRYSKASAALLVIFNEGGASAFFTLPLHELSCISVPLNEILTDGNLNEIGDKLSEAQSHSKRISIVEQLLIDRLGKTRPDLLILRAVREIRAAKGNIKVTDLLADFPVSRDVFEKRFRSIVGTSPKQFSSVVRFKDLIQHYKPEMSLTEAAYLAGYYDQSHFIKDFRAFTGQSPKDFFRSALWW